MRDLFLAFCVHPFYAAVFMAWISCTVESIVVNIARASIKILGERDA